MLILVEVLAAWLIVVLATMLIVAYMSMRWGRDPFGWLLLAAAMGPIAIVGLVGTRQSDVERGRRAHATPTRGDGRARVLIACDGSAPALAAAQHATTLGGHNEAMLLTVLPHESRPRSDPRSRADYDERVAKATRGSLEILRGANMDVRDAVVFGSPGEEIVRFAAQERVDVIVVGRRGAGLSRALLGSTSDYVVKHAPCPVTVVG